MSHRENLCTHSVLAGSALKAGVAGYSERSFFRRHGRPTNLREVACYHSHIRALRLFLSSGEEHALICEDDLALKTDPAQIVKRLLNHAGSWDIARLSGLKEATGVNAFSLQPGYFLRVNFGRLKGSGAYLLNRRADQKITDHLLPMRVPFDHAIDREWIYGLKAVSVSPFPIDQSGTGFRTSIQRGPARKLSKFRRLCFTYPYQALNEVSRWLFRIPRALALCFGARFAHRNTPFLGSAGLPKSLALPGSFRPKRPLLPVSASLTRFNSPFSREKKNKFCPIRPEPKTKRTP